jgi:hypothetical protein
MEEAVMTGIWSQGHKRTDNGWKTSDKTLEVTGYVASGTWT